MVDSVGGTHHVKIGDDYFLVYPNSYFKRTAPAFGARFAGGDPDYSQLNFWQHWGQSCWIGGLGQTTWEDDAMYDYAVGVDTSQHDMIVLARGLTPGGTGSTLGGEDRPRRFHAYDHALYAYDWYGSLPSHIYKYNESTDTWSTFKTWATANIGAVASFSGDLYVGLRGSYIRKYKSGTWKGIKKPKKRKETPSMMANYRNRLYVGFGRRIFRLKPNDKWDGNKVFFNGPGISSYVDSELHQGFLYFASANGHIVRTDGNQTFDLYQFGSKVTILSIESYDGKLFIFTKEWYDDQDIAEMVVYQMSGAAVTELKRYGRSGKAVFTRGAAEIARRMFYGASSLLGESDETGFGIAVYDAREDAHSMFSAQRDVTTYPDAGGDGKDHIVDDIQYWGGRIFAHIQRYGVFRSLFSYRDYERALAEYDNSWEGAIAVGNNQGGVLVSSEFNAGTPSLNKMWRKIDVTADLLDDGSVVNVGYSTDGGQNWVDVGSLTKTGAETHYTKSFYLTESDGAGGQQAVESESFKYKLQLDTDNPDYSPFVRSVIVSFLPNPEPNWMWDFTMVLAEKVQLLDGTVATVDVDAARSAIETAIRTQQLVEFTDIDGTVWSDAGVPGVLIQDATFSAPFIGPSSDGDIEYTVQLRMLEAIEAA